MYLAEAEVRPRSLLITHIQSDQLADIAELFVRLGFHKQVEITDELGTIWMSEERYLELLAVKQNSGENSQDNGIQTESTTTSNSTSGG